MKNYFHFICQRKVICQEVICMMVKLIGMGKMTKDIGCNYCETSIINRGML